MQKIISSFIFLQIFLPLFSFAQTFNGGVSAGLAASQVAGDTYSGYNKAGIFAGIYINHQINPKGLLQFEFDFIQKGSRHNPDPEKNDFITFKLATSYIEIPLMYRHHISKKFDLEAGIAPGFLINSKETINDGPASGNEFQSFSFSTIFGIYYYFSDRLFINFRTNDSVLSIRKEALEGYVKRFTGEYGQYHDVLIFSFFYQINHP